MKTIVRRLKRLEQRFGLVVESGPSKELRRRLEAARVRCGLPAVSPERLTQLRGMRIVEILHAGRLRVSALLRT